MPRLRYKIEAGDFKPEDFKDGEWGGCDALVLTSIVRDGKPAHQGGISFLTVTADGVGAIGQEIPEISATELFSVWSKMALDLSNSNLSDGLRGIAEQAFEATRELILKSR